jgi:2-polyprenyl-3-methyl-5-hydroxy-6-metoxy-1,4-benzoquinol methylase
MKTQQHYRRDLKRLTFIGKEAFAIGAAAELNLFPYLHQPITAEELAQKTGCSVKGLRMTLDALTALEIVEKQGNAYQLPDGYKPFFGNNDIFSFEHHLKNVVRLTEGWLQLPEAVKNGKLERQRATPEMFVHLTKGLFAMNYEEGQELYHRLKERHFLKILDVGAGACVWSIPFAQNNPSVHAFAIDQKPVIENVAVPTLSALNLTNQYTLISGDFWDTRWGEDYDLIILGHIAHSFSQEMNIELFKLAKNALKPHGVLAVVDFIPDESRQTRVFPLIFALNMLLYSNGGDVYTFSEYQAMLTESGFHGFEMIQLDEGHGADVVIAQ